MKKNLMSVLILALVVANLILTAILMISVVPQTKKANELVTKVCSAIDLELEGGKEKSAIDIPMDQLETVKIANGDSLTINLKSENDRKSYAKISISLAVDKKNKGYKKGLEAITANEDIIKNEIIKIVTNYTIDDMRDGQKELQDEVLVSLRKLFDSDFIVSVAFPTYTYEESSN
ncbi:MAG: flagellar basal body-associated FliL family protein [Lachnospiraceae bacterium]|jgi:Flagellar basal body-associated protein FliL.|nr:flagellar basal body-associated FliL family protein [Lachnospiraceae bacterium]